MRQLKAIDFFCGAGGMTYGLALAKIRVIAAEVLVKSVEKFSCVAEVFRGVQP